MSDPHEVLHDELGDRYTLEDAIGEGGMGTVYLARDRKHDRLVAIKTVRPDLTTSEIRERFEREISITAHLQHPHILPLLDSGVAGETLYYVMTYVDGESLRSRLDRDGRIPADELVRIARDVTEALQCAHEQGVVHRDIKPENILLTADYAVVADFGIAKALVETGAETLTRTGLAVGSPAYMAPEQIDGTVTPQIDIFALGAVLYEAATGQRYRGGAEAEANWWGIPSDLRAVIQRALHPSPEQRWPDAPAFRTALEASVRTSRRPWRTVALGALTAILLAGASWWVAAKLNGGGAEGGEGGSIQSLAVLPLVNLTGDPEQDYFVAGMHEALISELAMIRALRVISRTSVTRYADTELSAPEIAAELGVATVLEGGVQRAGDRVGVNVRLIDANADRHLWSQTYDEELTTGNIFMIQGDIAREIAAALQATLAPDVWELIESRPTESLEAYDLYTRGRYIANRSGTREEVESAADLYRQAIAADPAYAPAHVGLAGTYYFLWSQGFLAAAEALPQVRAAVERALELDATLAEAHAALGLVLRAELRFEEAEREFQRALELNPGSADVHLQYSQLLLDLARHEESVRETRRAVELDPLSMGNRLFLANTLMFTRDYDASIDESLRILELEPELSFAYYVLAAAYTLNGQHEEGLAAIRRSIELDPESLFGQPLLAWVSARAGQRDEALKALEQVEEQGPLLKEIAIVYGELGELDRAFEYLDRAFAEDPGSLTYMRADPSADSLKDDPRFAELMRKLGLE